MHTGDLGTLDERGCLRIVGRKKDMFIVGGFNAYPAEIENLLLGHPAVGRVAVVGMPDERLGEVGMAFVVPAPGAEVDPEELIGWARGTMANYKVPRAVEIVDDLPVNAGGKVEKDTLRARAAEPEAEGIAVDTRYSPEQLELRRSAAALVDDLGPRTVDDLDDAVRRGKLADAALRSGWFELRGPGEDDGPLASGVEVAIVARELGRAAADTPFFGPVVAADLARQAGLELEDARASIVLDGALLDIGVVPSSGAADGVAVDCAGAERGLVLVVDGGDAHVAEVELGEPAPGDRPHPRARAGHVDVVDVAHSTDGALDDESLLRCRALGVAIAVADLVGTMEGAIDTTCEYAKERQQYGVAIGSFQAVQHLLAEARVLLEGSISVSQYAAWAVDALPPDEALRRRRGRQGVLRTRRPHGVRDRDPGARRNRQHLGVLRARVPAPGAAVELVAGRRGAPPAGVGPPPSGRRTWTSVTRPRKPRSGSASAPG